MSEPFEYQIARCSQCPREAHVEVGCCDGPALCVDCLLGRTTTDTKARPRVPATKRKARPRVPATN